MNRLSYSILQKFKTFEERYEYLRLDGRVGEETFGFDRYLNQYFYTSKEWKEIREKIIARDYGWDLGVEGVEIHGPIIVHHMNPITKEELLHNDDCLLDPDQLISVSLRTHNAIHYGGFSIIKSNRNPVVRKQGDTKLW